MEEARNKFSTDDDAEEGSLDVARQGNRCNRQNEIVPLTSIHEKTMLIDTTVSDEFVPVPGDNSEAKGGRLKKRIVVRPGEPPPSKVTMQVVKHDNHVHHLQQKVLGGFFVEQSEWLELKKSVNDIQSFLSKVDFASDAQS